MSLLKIIGRRPQKDSNKTKVKRILVLLGSHGEEKKKHKKTVYRKNVGGSNEKLKINHGIH